MVGEFFQASLLISGMQPFFTFFTAAVVFFCFSLYQLASLLGVTGTCDCLGRFSPSPGVMLCIDIVSFAGLAIAARSSFRSSACLSQKLVRFRPVTFFLILLSCLFFVARNTQQWKYLSDVYSAETFASADNRNLFVVSGEDWVGKSFPVLPFVTRSAISTLPNS